MTRFFRFLLLLPLLPLSAAQTANEVEITAEPSHHQAIENQYVRVFKVEVAPGASTLMHRHRHDYVFVTLGDSDILNEVEGKAPVEVKLADGETRFTPGNFAHLARNLSSQPFRNITIELLQDEQMRSATSQFADSTDQEDLPGGHRKTLFIKDGVRVSSVQLNPGGKLPGDKFTRPTLIVAVNAAQLSNGIARLVEPAAGALLTPGALLWSNGKPAAERTNMGIQPARFIMLEFW